MANIGQIAELGIFSGAMALEVGFISAFGNSISEIYHQAEYILNNAPVDSLEPFISAGIDSLIPYVSVAILAGCGIIIGGKFIYKIWNGDLGIKYE